MAHRAVQLLADISRATAAAAEDVDKWASGEILVAVVQVVATMLNHQVVQAGLRLLAVL